MKNSRPIGIDLFCGAGGMSLGFKQAGFDIIAGVDIDPLHVDIHSLNFPKSKSICADISRLSGKELLDMLGIGNRKIDVLFGGPPCGGFSLIGKRKSNDPRNELLISFARLVKEIRPRYFVVENVRGLVIGKAEEKLDSFIKITELAEYSIVKPLRILNAKNYGVPQHRERVIILGYAKGLVEPIYPEPNNNHGKKNFTTVWDAIGDLPNIENIDYLLDSDVYLGKLKKAKSHYAKLLRGEIGDAENLSITRNNSKGISGFKRTRHTLKTINRFEATKPGTKEVVSRFFRLHKKGLARTLRAGTDKSRGGYTAPRPIHPVNPRCITVREGARLHSFPDWFQFHPTIWHGFRQVGNSVPPFLARAVAERVIETFCKN